MKPVIQLNHVTKRFGTDTVLHHITHSFAPGQIHGIVGHNGSGKTVLMKCICGFCPVEEGEILVRGKRVGKDMDFPPDLGILIETPGFLPRETGRRNLEILASLNQKIGKPEIGQALQAVGLDPSSRKKVVAYSLGMRQRLGLAQAMMESPSLLLLDEPMNGLDKEGRREMRALFSALRAQGKTILLASHFSEDIAELCDTVCEMDAGVLTRVK